MRSTQGSAVQTQSICSPRKLYAPWAGSRKEDALRVAVRGGDGGSGWSVGRWHAPRPRPARHPGNDGRGLIAPGGGMSRADRAIFQAQLFRPFVGVTTPHQSVYLKIPFIPSANLDAPSCLGETEGAQTA